MKPAVKYEMNLMELLNKFGSEERCREYLEALRFPTGIYCTRCNSTKISRIVKRNQFDCDECRYQFSATAGTIFHDTKLPLTKWFIAVYLMCESKKGISANQLKRTLNISYKSAWYLCHRIRKAVETNPAEKLSGTIEVDQTNIGGKFANMHLGVRLEKKKQPHYGKTIAVGALERDGKVKLQKVPDQFRDTLHEFIRGQVADGTENIYTDDWTAYDGIDSIGVKHRKVNHSAKEYVRGDVHTNGIENVWSLFKRSVIGSFHHISEKHLDRYLDEFEFRFNNRENPYLFRDTLLRLIGSGNMEYKDLVGK